jgi:hypothetical protein
LRTASVGFMPATVVAEANAPLLHRCEIFS